MTHSLSHFALRISPNDRPVVIISVSKKTAKLAVTRNLVKRRVRAAMRALVPKLRPKTYLLIARPGAEAVKGEALKQELAELFKIG